ncbi:MAG: Ni/Fe hydrogenase subunit alpha, partial [Actinomycetota bacterium]|jgi:sulfhydrogenase subunit alpha|nr:Ni/Fe hydrogenase subunit alpha [Actinomycetota bacterium]
MDIVEPARFFESMVMGRRFDEISLITSRICGICSPNHAVTSIKAIESAFDIEVSDRTTLLRKLLVYGSFLQNHATHLYLFAAPDFVGLPSVFPLAQTHPDVVDRALRIKKLGNDLTTLVGGRPVHPITAMVGGFASEPDMHKLMAFRELLVQAVDDAAVTVELFDAFEVDDLETAGDMFALSAPDDYAVYDGETTSWDAGWHRPVGEYRQFIVETVVDGTNSKHSTIDGGPFMVGALPRVNISGERLEDRARAALDASGFTIGSRNPLHNNLCQAVELVDACERCIEYIDKIVNMGGSSSPVPFDVVAGSGVGSTEAPRGTLYHGYAFDEHGRVVAGDIITPTAQSLANLEADMRVYAPTVAHLPESEFLLAMERLVRAYDPCLSCSVH